MSTQLKWKFDCSFKYEMYVKQMGMLEPNDGRALGILYLGFWAQQSFREPYKRGVTENREKLNFWEGSPFPRALEVAC